MAEPLVLGIDIGGTNTAFGIVNRRGEIIIKGNVPTTGQETVAEYIATLKHAILPVLEQAGRAQIMGVGIGAPNGNYFTGDIVFAPNLPWHGVIHMADLISEALGLKATLTNDANAAAYGEVKAIGLQEKTCVVAVTLGTGIGGGIIMNGRLYRGAHYAAGEIGHLRANLSNHRLCTCGLFDCWEAYGSGRGFRATAKELLTNVTVEQSPLAALLPDPPVDQVCAAAEQGDIIAQRIVSIYHEHVCAGIVTLAHTLDPDCFIISGGMAKFVNYDHLKELVIDRCLPRVGERLDIHRSRLGDDAGIIGAAELALDHLLRVQ